MAIGPGLYDHEISGLMLSTKARAIILMVFEGNKGSGFSVQAFDDIAPEIPGILRQMADQIEESTA
jgi:hypothetical protein